MQIIGLYPVGDNIFPGDLPPQGIGHRTGTHGNESWDFFSERKICVF